MLKGEVIYIIARWCYVHGPRYRIPLTLPITSSAFARYTGSRNVRTLLTVKRLGGSQAVKLRRGDARSSFDLITGWILVSRLRPSTYESNHGKVRRALSKAMILTFGYWESWELRRAQNSVCIISTWSLPNSFSSPSRLQQRGGFP